MANRAELYTLREGSSDWFLTSTLITHDISFLDSVASNPFEKTQDELTDTFVPLLL